MSLNKYKVRDESGTVIGQYQTHKEPPKPDGYVGDWIVEETETFNDEPVEWWDGQS